MSVSMHQMTIPVFVRALENLRGVIQIGEKFVADKGIAPEVMLQSRLMPDMLPFSRQVQIATDTAKNGSARLAGVDPLPFPDDETTFEQLHARIDRCIAYLSEFRPEQFEGSDARAISFKTRNGELHFQGVDYLTTFALPNLFFHVTAAYAILRVAGAPLGKNDYLGNAGR
jgi:hypothetical protein